MSDQSQDQAPILVQDCTVKPAKQPKIKVSRYKQTKDRGSRLPHWLLNDPISAFSLKYAVMLRILPKVKTANKPKFNAIFSRKFMILVYLLGIEHENGCFSILSIRDHFRQASSIYATQYFNKLLDDGWILAVNTHMVKHKEAVLSPLFFSLLQAMTSFLRRGHPEYFSPEVLNEDVKAMKPESSTLDYIQEITDPR